MKLVKRNIIKIDKSLCNKCGLCIDACTESALEMVSGFAQLIDERFCDGFGACTSECAPGALSIEFREALPFDEVAAEAHRRDKGKIKDDEHSIKWPFKLNLISAEAPFFKDTDIYLVSDCVPFAMKDFHKTIMKPENSLIVSCPKFDGIKQYQEKLKRIIDNSNPKSVTVVNMEIPCCNDIFRFVENIIKNTGKNIPLNRIIVGTNGSVKLVSS